MLINPSHQGYNYVTGNVIATRPTTNFGTSITPAQNSYGLYNEILAAGSITRDCYRVIININSIGATTSATDSLTTIGIDTAGGSSYVDLIPHLLSSAAAAYVTAGSAGGGHWYEFPLFIPAGSSLAAKGSINNATVGTQRVAIWLYGAPSEPSALKVGQGVEAIGITAGSSAGTAVTEGAAAEGSWTSLGTTAKQCFHWNVGMGVNNSNTAATLHHADLSFGDGTNNRIIILDKAYNLGSTETSISNLISSHCATPVGSTMYGRLQCSGTAQTGCSMAAYGVF